MSFNMYKQSTELLLAHLHVAPTLGQVQEMVDSERGCHGLSEVI
jgi:hypothetical protein